MKTLEEIKNSFREKFLTYTHWSSSNKSLSRLAKAEDVEDFLTQTYTSMVLAEVERLEGEKNKKLKYDFAENQFDEDPTWLAEDGYNQAIEDQINYWKNKIK